MDPWIAWGNLETLLPLKAGIPCKVLRSDLLFPNSRVVQSLEELGDGLGFLFKTLVIRLYQLVYFLDILFDQALICIQCLVDLLQSFDVICSDACNVYDGSHLGCCVGLPNKFLINHLDKFMPDFLHILIMDV